MYFFIRYRSSLPYSKALYKRKLISIKKWLQSTDYKNIAKVLFPFTTEMDIFLKTRLFVDCTFFIKENHCTLNKVDNVFLKKKTL